MGKAQLVGEPKHSLLVLEVDLDTAHTLGERHFDTRFYIMKHILIGLLMLAGLVACSGETKKELKASGEEASTESIILKEVGQQADSLEVNVQEKAEEIDILLKGI